MIQTTHHIHVLLKHPQNHGYTNFKIFKLIFMRLVLANLFIFPGDGVQMTYIGVT